MSEFVAFKHLLGLALEVLDELLHVRLQGLAPSAADLKCLRSIWIIEVVNVTPVLRERRITIGRNPLRGDLF